MEGVGANTSHVLDDLKDDFALDIWNSLVGFERYAVQAGRGSVGVFNHVDAIVKRC